MHRPPPQIIGHRAAAAEAPENTLAAAQVCLDAGANAMEIDVRLCADGVPVLLHDELLDRTTNLTGPVGGVSLPELREADAGDGQHVPSLDEVLAMVAGRAGVCIEIKASTSAEEDGRLVDAVLQAVDRHDGFAWCAIHSFSSGIVALARATQPRVSAARIALPVSGDERHRLLTGALKANAQAVSVHHSAVDAELVTLAHRRQLMILAWTADEPSEWDRLAAAGCDGVITNAPTRLAAHWAGGDIGG